MKCTFFNGTKAVGNLVYGIFREDPISIVSSSSDVFQVSYSCIKGFVSKREKNSFAVDLSNVKFDNNRLKCMEAGQRYRESPFYKEWQRKNGFREKKLFEEIKRISGII